MRYYEFIDAEDYALISVEQESNNVIEAMRIYIELVGGYDNIHQMKEENIFPKEISEKEARYKYITALGNGNACIRQLKEEFYRNKSDVLLIDYNLT